MRILYINEYFTKDNKTGANIVAFITYECVKSKGHKTYFFASDHKPFCDNNSITDNFPKGHKYGSLLFRLNSLYNFQAKRQLNKVIKQINPDIIHIHVIEELSYSILSTIEKNNIPCVMTIHDASYSCPIMGSRMYLCYKCADSVINCIINKCSRNNYFFSLYMTLKFIINKYYIKKYRLKKLILPSQALANYIKTSGFDNNVPTIVLPNCLDVTFENVTPNYSNKKYFLFVGNLNNTKGVKILLQTIKLLPKEINFKIVGTGICEQEYKEFVLHNNLHNVTFCGKMNRSQLIEEYKNCIALITPSTCFEIFGMINIEAFACGKPVIASNIGGIPEIVEDNVNGLLFEPGNVEQLKECILKYWNNQELAIEHGKNGYKKVITQYTEERYYCELMKVYEEVLSESKK